MQGEDIEQSVVNALNRINAVADDFDCVVIIRGGGSTSDLSGFDTLALAENVAQFPLPVITGIGHDRDESVLDMVSCIRVKTPTAAAQHLVTHAQRTLDRLTLCEEHITTDARNRLNLEQMRLTRLAERIPPLFSVVRSRQEARLDSDLQRLTASMLRRLDREQQRIETHSLRLRTVNSQRLTNEHHRLELLTQRTKALDPTLLLRRGYSITLLNGHVLRDPSDAHVGDEIVTRVEKGQLTATVTATAPALPDTPTSQP